LNRLVFILAFLLGGCAALPVADDADAVKAAAQVQQQYHWVHQLGGDELVALVREAWRANPGIEAASAAAQRARAQAVISGAARLPEVQLGLDAARSRTLFFDAHRIRSNFGLAADVSWLPDLWGRAADRYRAGVADAAAATIDVQAARLMLAADVTKSWLRLREAALQLALAHRQSENQAATLEVIQERYQAGLQEALDVYLAKENLATTRAAELRAQQQHDAAKRVLEALLGRFPAGRIAPEAALDALPGAVPEGIDSRVLLRRPDVAAWRQRFLAAEARSDEAAKNRFPAFSLTARGGTQSTRFSDLLDWDNLVWSLAAGIAQPLFTGGRLRAEQLLARANRREVLANYANTVLVALREVRTTLAAEPLLDARVAFQEEAASMAALAAELSVANYRAGLIDINTLLTAQRRDFSTRSVVLATKLERLLNRVDLHLAIGGDFETKGDNH
jgi:NodT family efflux transporter outer membrane factor (OMF) lipoprotein